MAIDTNLQSSSAERQTSSFPPNTGQLPLDEQLTHFKAALQQNTTLVRVLHLASTLDLPNWYVAAGAISQTIWNVVSGQPPETGIADYDLVYFDGSDLSWEAEDAVIRRGEEVFAGVGTMVEIRNQARVHLWYEDKFGTPCPQHRSTEQAIGAWTSNTAMIGVRIENLGEVWRVYAPMGLSDMFNLVIRPNPLIATRDSYEKKIARWRKHWTQLTIHPWPEGTVDVPVKGE